MMSDAFRPPFGIGNGKRVPRVFWRRDVPKTSTPFSPTVNVTFTSDWLPHLPQKMRVVSLFTAKHAVHLSA